jgi:hypothetical protein
MKDWIETLGFQWQTLHMHLYGLKFAFDVFMGMSLLSAINISYVASIEI